MMRHHGSYLEYGDVGERQCGLTPTAINIVAIILCNFVGMSTLASAVLKSGLWSEAFCAGTLSSGGRIG